MTFEFRTRDGSPLRATYEWGRLFVSASTGTEIVFTAYEGEGDALGPGRIMGVVGFDTAKGVPFNRVGVNTGGLSGVPCSRTATVSMVGNGRGYYPTPADAHAQPTAGPEGRFAIRIDTFGVPDMRTGTAYQAYPHSLLLGSTSVLRWTGPLIGDDGWYKLHTTIVAETEDGLEARHYDAGVIRGRYPLEPLAPERMGPRIINATSVPLSVYDELARLDRARG